MLGCLLHALTLPSCGNVQVRDLQAGVSQEEPDVWRVTINIDMQWMLQTEMGAQKYFEILDDCTSRRDTATLQIYKVTPLHIYIQDTVISYRIQKM